MPSLMKSVCAAALVSGFAMPTMATAQEQDGAIPESEIETLTFDEMLVLDAQSYVKLYGVSLEEAMRRVMLMHDTQEEVIGLSEEFAGQIGGQYFTHGSEFGLEMRLTGKVRPAARSISPNRERAMQRKAERTQAIADRQSAGRARRAERLAELGITSRALEMAQRVSEAPGQMNVRFSAEAAADRQTVFDLITARFQDVKELLPTIDSASYDERRTSVVINVVGEDNSVRPADLKAVEALFPVPVVLQYVNKRLTSAAAYGGTPTVNFNGAYFCTNAFVGTNPSGQAGLFGASHCQYGNNQSIAMNLWCLQFSAICIVTEIFIFSCIMVTQVVFGH